ncbi:MAG: 3,4-dihydroxy-2-butanone-4-phosphate synthase [Gammaproteobacteria bacterium]|nr:3,4-dihydroxy-2-butanone-4-phosphate synthase [Gammaproteobacteria bacterium]MCH9763176.1 3,4-dihydroxy-2-butanone-4-phosphate synthase [Gammaproteobacteria bacterium]
MTNFFSSVEDALIRLRAGRMVILTDDEARENEGDLIVSAEHITPEVINFMTHFGRGLICLPMAGHLIDKLDLPMMTSRNRSPYGTGFTVSIEAATGVSTGISAKDRAHTIQAAIADEARPKDIISPGHVFPLRARAGGVFERQGQTEGSVDLMQLSGLKSAAVICEIINEDGTMSRRDDLLVFSKKHDIPLVSVRDVMHYRIQQEVLVDAVATSRLPIRTHGDFTMTLFQNKIDSAEHFTLMKEPVDTQSNPLVRIHSECITGDLFGSTRCDCGAQLDASLELIAKEGGVLVYLRQEGRGIGLTNKLKAYALQDTGLDTVEANVHLGLPVDSRDYAVAFQLLRSLGLKQVRLLTNNPLKIEALEQYGMTVTERLPVQVLETTDNRDYLKTKREKLGHLLDLELNA